MKHHQQNLCASLRSERLLFQNSRWNWLSLPLPWWVPYWLSLKMCPNQQARGMLPLRTSPNEHQRGLLPPRTSPNKSQRELLPPRTSPKKHQIGKKQVSRLWREGDGQGLRTGTSNIPVCVYIGYSNRIEKVWTAVFVCFLLAWWMDLERFTLFPAGLSTKWCCIQGCCSCLCTSLGDWLVWDYLFKFLDLQYLSMNEEPNHCKIVMQRKKIKLHPKEYFRR